MPAPKAANINHWLSFENGMLFTEGHRAVLISAQAFGTLQKDLIENIGVKRAQAFLFRYGWSLGEQDADIAMKHKVTLEEQLEQGPVLHAQKGFCLASMKKMRIEGRPPSVKSFYMEGIWRESYESAGDMKSSGCNGKANCHTLTGYASGYISKIIGQTVIFKEQACIAAGADECKWVGKLAVEWGGNAEQQLNYCSELPILRELETAHEKLLDEKEQLAHVTAVHKLLTEEIIKGNGIDSIVRVMHEQIGFPILIENIYGEVLAYKGADDTTLIRLQKELLDYVSVYSGNEVSAVTETAVIATVSAKRLISPINLHGEIIGYCSFFINDGEDGLTDINRMFIERMCTVCALSLLNEKVKHDSEERMKSRLLDDLLKGRYADKKEIARRSAPAQINLFNSYNIITLDSPAAGKNYKEELKLHEDIKNAVSKFLKKESIKALISDRSSKLVALLTELEMQVEPMTIKLLAYLKETFKGTAFKIGIGSAGENIMEAAGIYQESLTALRMTTSKEPIVTFQSLGIIGFLLHSNDCEAVNRIAERVLGELYKKNDIDLLKTFYTYLCNGGNLDDTAEELSLSVSGLRYRINKINTILGISNRTAEEDFQYLLALKVLVLNNRISI